MPLYYFLHNNGYKCCKSLPSRLEVSGVWFHRTHLIRLSYFWENQPERAETLNATGSSTCVKSIFTQTAIKHFPKSHLHYQLEKLRPLCTVQIDVVSEKGPWNKKKKKHPTTEGNKADLPAKHIGMWIQRFYCRIRVTFWYSPKRWKIYNNPNFSWKSSMQK